MGYGHPDKSNCSFLDGFTTAILSFLHMYTQGDDELFWAPYTEGRVIYLMRGDIVFLYVQDYPLHSRIYIDPDWNTFKQQKRIMYRRCPK